MPLRFFIVALVLVLARTAPARAQAEGPGMAEPSAAGVLPLTIDEARGLAAASAPSVASSAALIAIAHADTGIAGMLPNPRLGVGGGINYLFVVDFFILLPIFGQRETAEEAASAQERAVTAGVEVVRLDAQLAAALAWIDLHAAEHELTLGTGDAARRDRLLEIARGRFDEDTGSRLDVVRADVEARRARAEIAALEGAVHAARARLGALLGEPAERPWTALGPPAPERPRVPARAAFDGVIAQHPVLLRMAAMTHAADRGVERAHRARFPVFGLSVSDWVSRSTESSDFRVLVTAEVPLFDEPRIERAEAVRAAARTDEEGIALGLRAGLEAARAEFSAAADRCRAEEDEVLPATEEAAALALEGYERGALDLTAVLVAEQAQADAERRLLTCVVARARAWARLVHAMGGTAEPGATLEPGGTDA